MEIDLNFEELLEKVKKMKESGSVDLSTEEDLALAIMNLISIEEHLCFTGMKTEKDSYYETMNEVREMRKKFLARMIDRHEGETWCTSKHLLSATYRLIEVGTKLFSDGKKDEAKDFFDNAHKLFAIFWALRLKLISAPEAKKIVGEQKKMSMKDIMDKMVDCCDE